jgi:predicted DsbA family dithiol-disulfide isomerase/uncharacterized membrane protein
MRVLALVALAASAALYIDYRTGGLAFCSASGCGEVRRSGFGYLFGRSELPVPLLGLLGFGGLVGVSLLRPGRWRERLILGMGVAGGLAALGFIALMAFAIGSFCWLCMVADTMALLIAAGAILRHALGGAAPAAPRHRAAELLKPWAWVSLCVLAVGGPLLWPHLRPLPPVPDAIAELYAPGKINVVEFFDFHCGHCRDLYPRLEAILAEYGDQVAFQQLHKPLGRRPGSRDAARAAICAEEQGKGPAMADRLFAAKDLSREANRGWAQELGLDVTAFDECVTDPATDARINRDATLLAGPDFLGLPTTFVQGQKIVGSRGDEVFRDALRLAAQGKGDRGIPGWVFLGLLVGIVVVVARLGRVRPAPRGGSE